MSEKKYKVFTPNKDFDGRRFGVTFEKGLGLATEKEAIVLHKNWGYDCPELFPEEVKDQSLLDIGTSAPLSDQDTPPVDDPPKPFNLAAAKPGEIVKELARMGHTEFDGKALKPLLGKDKLTEIYLALTAPK